MEKLFLIVSLVILCLSMTAQTKPAIEWVYIPAGTFTMGSPDNEFDRNGLEYEHKVTVNAFKMSKFEITFVQYDKFCEATGRKKPDDNGWGRGNRPVINVSWDDANSFANWMNCRLPTEAEWEYACRAGTTTPFSTGENIITLQANYNGNFPYMNHPKGEYKARTVPVGSYAPNSFGLYDMHGNVWEWVNDWYEEYLKIMPHQTNPTGPEKGIYRVYRGGGWNLLAQFCRSAKRRYQEPGRKFNYLGFRMVSSE